MKKQYTSLVIILLSLVAGFYFYSNQAVKTTEYKDLKLGMSMDEVIYTMGYPDGIVSGDTVYTHVGDDIEKYVHEDEINKKGGFKAFPSWRYDDGFLYKELMSLEFDLNNKLIEIRCSHYYDPQFCEISGIHALSTEEQVIGKLGKPTEETLDTKTYIKKMIYHNYNLVIVLKQKKVYSIGIREF
jgi:hypothetical protein